MSPKSYLQLYLLTQQKCCLTAAAILLAEQEERQRNRSVVRFSLKNKADIWCVFNFRFDKHEIHRLQQALGIPQIIRARNLLFNGDEGLCILLRRLVYPNRLRDLIPIFGRDKSQLSRIFNYMLDFICTRFGYLTESLDLFWLNEDYLENFAHVIRRKGAPLETCVGFIDGTLRPICKPKEDQRECYNGHKRVHGLKFQSVVVRNGIISNLFGPIEGRRHDSYLLSQSGLLPELQVKFNRGPGQTPYCLYGDPAYPLRPQLIAPYRSANITDEQKQFNKSMSAVRQAVEWEFGKVPRYFAFCDFKKNLKLHLQPVAKYYKVAVILTNCHTCLNGSITSRYFNVNPPNLESYLTNTET